MLTIDKPLDIRIYRRLGYSDSRPLPSILEHIMVYCQQQDLPPLTIIVVNQDGTPGEGFTAASRHEFDRKREEVFSFDWFGIRPPSIEEFKQAWNLAYNNAKE